MAKFSVTCKETLNPFMLPSTRRISQWSVIFKEDMKKKESPRKRLEGSLGILQKKGLFCRVQDPMAQDHLQLQGQPISNGKESTGSCGMWIRSGVSESCCLS